MRAYRELAPWWPLFSPPYHYAEEAEDLLPTVLAAPDRPPRTLLELGGPTRYDVRGRVFSGRRLARHHGRDAG